ncbi:methyl-accepting chemotaxis protein [Halanaerocella petrolearia]
MNLKDKINFNLKIGTKLYLGFGLLIILLIAFGFYVRGIMSEINSQSTIITDDQLPSINLINSIDDLAFEYRISQFDYITATTEEGRQEAKKNMEDVGKKYEAKLSKYKKTIDSRKEKELLNTILSEHGKYINISNKVMKLSKQKKTKEARKLMLGEAKIHFNKAASMLNRLVRYNINEAKQASKHGDILYSKSIRNLAIIGFINFVVALLIAFIITKSIVNPLDILRQELEKLANNGGDLTQEIKVETKDEIGDLATVVNQFLSNLRKMIKEVKDSAQQTLSTCQELNASSEETSASIEEVSASVEELTATIESTNESSSQISDNASRVNDLADNGLMKMDATQEEMEETMDYSQESIKNINQLSQVAEEIIGIVDIISNIAEQTNLLALNAAIEAARAGEHGQGFAVVAEEIRSLAEETQSSTENIKELVSRLDSQTKETIDVIEDSNEQIKAGAEIVDEAEESFATITERIKVVVEQINQSDRAMKEIASGSDEISSATEEQSAAMEQITNSTQELANMAEDLEGLVDKFKV